MWSGNSSGFARHKTTQKHVLSKRVVLTYLIMHLRVVRATRCGAAPHLWRAAKTLRHLTYVRLFHKMATSRSRDAFVQATAHPLRHGRSARRSETVPQRRVSVLLFATEIRR